MGIFYNYNNIYGIKIIQIYDDFYNHIFLQKYDFTASVEDLKKVQSLSSNIDNSVIQVYVDCCSFHELISYNYRGWAPLPLGFFEKIFK
jgi:hypothetical protein